jgi:CheY-like chemotaxis protein
VVAGNQAPSWAPPGACRSEGFSLRGLDTAFVAVADDNHHHRIPILRDLRATGHEVLHAAGPRSCERLIQDSTHDIAALVCCAEMKEMSGFELARRVIQRRPDIRVLLIFRDGSDRQERDRASSLGYAHVLQSTSPAEICSELARLLASPDPRDRLSHPNLVASRD